MVERSQGRIAWREGRCLQLPCPCKPERNSMPTLSEGLRQFHASDPDVVVLDLKLPDGSGLELFEAIRTISPKLPVIFITAHGSTKSAIRSEERRVGKE